MIENNPPRRGQDYTLQEILKELDLRDSPCLMFDHEGKECCIQYAHVNCEQFLSVPGIASLLWEYERTTHEEWRPIFRHSTGNTPRLLECLDIEPDKNSEGEFWVTPKGFPREQYVPQ